MIIENRFTSAKPGDVVVLNDPELTGTALKTAFIENGTHVLVAGSYGDRMADVAAALGILPAIISREHLKAFPCFKYDQCELETNWIRRQERLRQLKRHWWSLRHHFDLIRIRRATELMTRRLGKVDYVIVDHFNSIVKLAGSQEDVTNHLEQTASSYGTVIFAATSLQSAIRMLDG